MYGGGGVAGLVGAIGSVPGEGEEGGSEGEGSDVALSTAVVKLVMAAQIVIAMNVSRQVRLLGKERAARQRREEKFALPIQIPWQFHLIAPPPGLLCQW